MDALIKLVKESYLEANKNYQKRYSEFKRTIIDHQRSLNEGGAIVYYNPSLIAKSFNINQERVTLSVDDFLNGKYQE